MDNNELNQVLQRITRAEMYVKEWKKNIQHWRNLYNMRHYDSDMENAQSYNDPTHTNAVDLAVGIMLSNKLRWHGYGFSPSKKEQRETGMLEKFLEATWEINNQREERSNEYELLTHFVRDGAGVIYSVFDPNLAETSVQSHEIVSEMSEEGTEQVSAFTESPLRVQIIDPEKVFLLPGGPKRWLLIGRSEKMSVLDAMSRYPDADFSKYAGYTEEDKSTIEGKFMDIWDYVNVEGNKIAVRNTVMFEDIPLMGTPRIMEGYTDLPYTVQFYKPTGTDPRNWHNIMKPQETSIDLLERTINRRSRQIDIFTALPLISKTQTGRVVQVDNSLFNHVSIGMDESIEFPEWRGNAPDVQMHIDFLRSRVNQSGFSEVMFGMGGNGDSAGYAISQLSDQNRIRLEQPIKHFELLMSTWARKSLSLMKEYASGMYVCVYGQHKGKDFNEYVEVDRLSGYAVEAEVRASFPAEETRKVAMASQSKGILSDYSIMERYFDIEQPEDEQERKLIEITSANPAVINYSIMAELSERAEDGDQIAATVLQMMQSQLQGEQGRPPNPTNPEQPTGTQSSTGQPVPQAAGGQPAGQSSADQMRREAARTPNMQGGV